MADMHDRTRTGWPGWLASSLCIAAVLGLGCATAAPTFQFNFAEQRAKLEANGLRLIVLPDSTTELIEVDVRYQVGSSADPEGKAGLAHLVEHLMFQQRPEGDEGPPLMHYIQRITTFFNAYTNWDTTHYMALGRKENLENFFQIEAMRMFYGCKTISEAEFQREREVVRNEIRQRTGTPEGQIQQLILSDVYPKSHAYARSIGGNDQQLTNITLEDACAFMAKYYVPSNATIIVAGNTTREEVTPLAAKWFNKLPRVAASNKRVEPLVLKKTRISHDVAVERPRLYVAWALPAVNTKDGEVARFALGALSNRVSLFGDRWDFATSVTPQIIGGRRAQVFVIAVELKNEGKRSQALDFIWKAARSAHRGIKFADFRISKIQWRADFVMDLESLPSRTNLLGDLVQFYNNMPWNSEEQLWRQRFDAIEAIDESHIADVMKRVLNPKHAVVVDIKASAEGIAGDARASLRFTPTASHDVGRSADVDEAEAHKPFGLPQNVDLLSGATRFTLKNGMNVVLLSSSSMPVVSARLVFDVGSAHEPAKQAGLARVTARMLRSLDSADIERQFVRSRGSVGSDHTVITAEVVDIYMDALLEDLERTVTVGGYSQRAIESWQKRMRYQLKSRQQRENQTFRSEVVKAIFGPEHPYATRGMLTAKSVGAIGRDAAMKFKRKHYSAANATLILTGQFDVAKAEKLIRKRFSGWRKGHEDEPTPSAISDRDQPVHIGVVAENRPQMQVAIAYPGPAGIDAGHAIRLILREMLTLRMGAIRHELGASYGVYANWSPAQGPSMYVMGGEVDAEKAGESLVAMRRGIDDLRKGYSGFDADFVQARRRVIQALLGQSTVSSSVASRLDTLARFDLPADHDTKLLRRVARAKPVQVLALAQKELKPEREAVICLAERGTLEAAFAYAKLADPQWVEPGE